MITTKNINFVIILGEMVIITLSMSNHNMKIYKREKLNYNLNEDTYLCILCSHV